jgi:hypothetical protein
VDCTVQVPVGYVQIHQSSRMDRFDQSIDRPSASDIESKIWSWISPKPKRFTYVLNNGGTQHPWTDMIANCEHQSPAFPNDIRLDASCLLLSLDIWPSGKKKLDSLSFNNLYLASFAFNFKVTFQRRSTIIATMKFSSITILLATTLSAATAAAAFAPTTQQETTTNSALSASRRDIFGALAFGVAAVVVPQTSFADARPMYLVEPTDEFKENEAKSMAFKREQLRLKKEFISALEQFTETPNDEEALAKDIKDLQMLVKKDGGLPMGIVKDDMVKIIRSKKSKGFWPTSVEVAWVQTKI